MLTLWIVSDGKPGHRNQSLGLAEAIGLLEPARIEVIELAGGFFGRLSCAFSVASKLARPDVIIGAGHATHLPLLALGRRFGAATVVLMRPSLPASWFDVCLVPRHDLAKRRAGGNVIATVGALNRIVPAAGPRQPSGVFLIGGPAPADLPGLVEALATIAAAAPQLAWTLTDSRRTPTEFLPSLRPLGLPLEVYGHATTPGDWLPQQLASASDVWVTPDSVSMIHEALTSGARVGLLPCPQTLSAPRLSASVAQLVAAGWLAPYDAWLATRRLPEPPAPLAEAQRCAPRVLEHLRGRRKVPLTGKR